MLAFTNECLLSSENLLQRSLFIVLGSMEVIAQMRVASILHLDVLWPLQWLAGNTHKLAHCQWGERLMWKAIDLLYKAFVKIEADGLLILDHEFMINIFSPLYEQLPEFKKDFYYLLEEKEGNTIGSKKRSDRVLSIYEALSELFYPVKLDNVQTTS